MHTELNHSSVPEQESKIDELVSLLAEHRAYWTTAVENLEHIGKTYTALMQEMLHRLTTQRVKVTEAKPRKKKLFHPDIDESLMAAAMYEVYEKTLGAHREVDLGIKPIDLMAYLFLMVVEYHYGRHDFRDNGKKPFFDFFISQVRPELLHTHGTTRKTMGNRINEKSDFLEALRGRKELPEALKKLSPAYARKLGRVFNKLESFRRKLSSLFRKVYPLPAMTSTGIAGDAEKGVSEGTCRRSQYVQQQGLSVLRHG